MDAFVLDRKGTFELQFSLPSRNLSDGLISERRLLLRPTSYHDELVCCFALSALSIIPPICKIAVPLPNSYDTVIPLISTQNSAGSWRLYETFLNVFERDATVFRKSSL